MKKVEASTYLKEKKPLLKELLSLLLAEYSYASILAADSYAKQYSVSASGIHVRESMIFGLRGFVVKVFDHGSYAEYSFNEIDEEALPRITAQIRKSLVPLTERLPDGLKKSVYDRLPDEPESFEERTTYELHPRALGDEAILTRLKALSERGRALDTQIIDVHAELAYQEYSKLFLSANQDMEQSALWCTGAIFAIAKRGEVLKENYKVLSVLGGVELLDQMDEKVEGCVRNAVALLDSEPIPPGEYECICTPDVTGMIVHEAFGHGVEMDMFVKDRALAQTVIGQPVASPLVTMHDGNAVKQTATYFFDDEGTRAHDTVVIEKGILKRGLSDAQTALHLGTVPTGNGRRESYLRKAYTRMTNTYFEAGTDSVEDMIASVKDGVLLEAASSGMEDPKNWGIQCMVDIAREIKDGKLTGRIFSPIVLTGYVPDLLKSITMMSKEFELSGGGFCGKGYKEYIKVSDGGPYIKARIRLG